MDDPDPCRDLHRPRDQRLPAGRVLIRNPVLHDPREERAALRASSLTRFYFTCSVAELIDVPRADYHFDFWEDFVTGSTYRGDVASELTAHIVLKLNK